MDSFRFLGESRASCRGPSGPHHSADAEYVHTLDPEFYPGRQGSQWRICSPAGQIDPPSFPAPSAMDTLTRSAPKRSMSGIVVYPKADWLKAESNLLWSIPRCRGLFSSLSTP